MKRLFTSIVLAAVAIFGLTGCSLFYYEEVDTIVEWGWAEKENTRTVFGIEALLESSQTIYDAFDATFCKVGESMGRSHEVLFPGMNGEKKAANYAKKLAQDAHAKLPAGHTCPVNYIWVVNIYYGAGNNPKTVWSHDYRN